ncbi:hypothetical protein Tco_1318519 [Tanacetum coccineum]
MERYHLGTQEFIVVRLEGHLPCPTPLLESPTREFAKHYIGKGLFGPSGGSGGAKEGRFGGGMGISTFGEGMVGSMSGVVRGSLAIRSMVAKEGLGGDKLVVDGGRSPRISRRVGDDGGVENKSSRGSKVMGIGVIALEVRVEGRVGAGGGEVKGIGVDLGVLMGSSFGNLIGDKGGDKIGEFGGACEE